MALPHRRLSLVGDPQSAIPKIKTRPPLSTDTQGIMLGYSKRTSISQDEPKTFNNPSSTKLLSTMKKAPSPSTGLQIPGGPLSEATRLNIGSHLPKSRKYMVHPFVEEPHVKPPHLRHIIKPYLQPTTPTSFDCDKDLTYEKPIRGVKESALKRTVMEGHRVLAGEELHYGKKPKPESPAGVFSGGVEPINLKKKPMVEDPSRLSNILPQQRIYDKFVHGTKNDVLSHNTDTLRRLKGGELLHGNNRLYTPAENTCWTFRLWLLAIV